MSKRILVISILAIASFFVACSESDEVTPEMIKSQSTAPKSLPIVTVEEFVRHSLYGKAVKVTKKFKAHDEQNECNIGDKVRIMETRPLSKDKRWRLVNIVEKVK